MMHIWVMAQQGALFIMYARHIRPCSLWWASYRLKLEIYESNMDLWIRPSAALLCLVLCSLLLVFSTFILFDLLYILIHIIYHYCPANFRQRLCTLALFGSLSPALFQISTHLGLFLCLHFQILSFLSIYIQLVLQYTQFYKIIT